MLLKVIAIIAFIGAYQAAEHAYSSQNITRFDNNHDHHDDHAHEENNGYDNHKHAEHKTENKIEHQREHKIIHPIDTHAIVLDKAEPYGINIPHHEPKIENKPHHDLSLTEQKPVHHEHKVEHKIEHKVEPKKEDKVEAKKEQPEEKQEEKKLEQDDHKQELHTRVTPVVETREVHVTTVKVVPVAQYVQKIANNHKDHEPATSYQHISRQDVPAPPPKDFTDFSGTSKYEFAYEVKDAQTGDHKYQHEASDGHAVKGVYSLHQADGSISTVQYAAHKNVGFSAAVKETTKQVEEKKHT